MFRHISIQSVLGWPQKNWKPNDRKRFQYSVVLSKSCQQQNAPNTYWYVFHPFYLEKAGAFDCSLFFREIPTVQMIYILMKYFKLWATVHSLCGRDTTWHHRPWLTHWGRDNVDATSQTTFWSAVSWMKIFEFRLRFHWSLFLRVQLTMFQHWFR